MRAIICYDFENDKDRAVFAKLLSRYGFRIQYSVFEFHLDVETWASLKQKIDQKKSTMKGNCSVVIVPLSEPNYKKIEYIGNAFLYMNQSSVVYSGESIYACG